MRLRTIIPVAYLLLAASSPDPNRLVQPKPSSEEEIILTAVVRNSFKHYVDNKKNINVLLADLELCDALGNQQANWLNLVASARQSRNQDTLQPTGFYMGDIRGDDSGVVVDGGNRELYWFALYSCHDLSSKYVFRYTIDQGSDPDVGGFELFIARLARDSENFFNCGATPD